MKIAIVGTGISGLVAAYLLAPDHDITVYEAHDYIGGHTNTLTVERATGTYTVDTGFVVFNDRSYPNFIKLLTQLGVAWQPSPVSFSVTCTKTGLEYNGTSLNSLFAQRRNLFRPSFYRLIRDIRRFYREAPALLQDDDNVTSLGDYLLAHQYSQEFVEQHIIPMGAAIGSADFRQLRDFPARYFVQFFHTHGLLSVDDHPQWRVIDGGSYQYVEALTRSYRERIRLGCPVRSIIRHPDHVTITPSRGQAARFDYVILATHSDQALALLSDATELERAMLGAFSYQENEAVLHTDESLLPKRRRAWAGWNYYIVDQDPSRVAITYNLNILQNLRAPETFCVTLNRTEAIDPATIIYRMTYHHPVYTPRGVATQKRYANLHGVNRTFFCGAYWGYGFHEDGVNSALAVCRYFDKGL